MILDGGKTGHFLLSALLNSKYLVLFCSVEVRASRRRDQCFVLQVRTVCSDRVTRTAAQANVAQVERLIEKSSNSGIRGSTGKAGSLMGQAVRVRGS